MNVKEFAETYGNAEGVETLMKIVNESGELHEFLKTAFNYDLPVVYRDRLEGLFNNVLFTYKITGEEWTLIPVKNFFKEYVMSEKQLVEDFFTLFEGAVELLMNKLNIIAVPEGIDAEEFMLENLTENSIIH